MNWTTPPGTSHAETLPHHRRGSSSELRSLPGVRYVGAHVGRAVTGDQVVGINSSQIWVSIDPQGRLRQDGRGDPRDDRRLPGHRRTTCRSYLRDKVGEVLTGEEQGDRRAHLRPASARSCGRRPRKSGRRLSGIAGIVDLHAEGQVEEPQVQVKVNLDAAGRANVKPGDVRRSVGDGLLRPGGRLPVQGAEDLRGRGLGCARGAPEPDQPARSVGRQVGPHATRAWAMSPT